VSRDPRISTQKSFLTFPECPQAIALSLGAAAAMAAVPTEPQCASLHDVPHVIINLLLSPGCRTEALPTTPPRQDRCIERTVTSRDACGERFSAFGRLDFSRIEWQMAFENAQTKLLACDPCHQEANISAKPWPDGDRDRRIGH
jgi:hypothetical protein